MEAQGGQEIIKEESQKMKEKREKTKDDESDCREQFPLSSFVFSL